MEGKTKFANHKVNTFQHSMTINYSQGKDFSWCFLESMPTQEKLPTFWSQIWLRSVVELFSLYFMFCIGKASCYPMAI